MHSLYTDLIWHGHNSNEGMIKQKSNSTNVRVSRLYCMLQDSILFKAETDPVAVNQSKS